MVFLAIFGAGKLYSQTYYFSHYQVENGLSSNSVMCSLQDKRGFLWFGTRDGLNNFNGYRFKVFRNDPKITNSLGGNFIHSLHEDAGGKIWVGTDRGLYNYNYENESFSKLYESPVDEIRDIKSDRDNLWFIAAYQLHRYNAKSGKLTVYGLKDYFEATSICVTNNEVLIGTTNGLIEKYVPATDSFIGYSVFDSSKPASSKFIQRIFNTGKGSLLIGTSKSGVKLFDISTHQYKDIQMLNEDHTPIFARDIINYAADEYWIATESGVFIYNLRTNFFSQIKKSYNDPYSLSDNAIYTFCKDREGGVWVGTYFGGINHYSKLSAVFEKYFPKVGENSLSGNAVREIHQDKDKNIWIGTEDGGLNRLDRNGKFTSFNLSLREGSISNNNIHGLLITGDTLWVGTFESGLDLFRISTSRVIRHFEIGNGLYDLKSNFIYAIYRTRAGQVFLATGRGLYNYDYESHRLTPCYTFPDLFYTEFFEDSKGGQWAGTYSSGIYYKAPDRREAGRFKELFKLGYNLNNDRINTIFEDSDGVMWFGTERGLYKFNVSRNTLSQYTIKDGLPSDVIFAILPDHEKRLWISTSKGLVCFNTRKGEIKVFTKANGLLSDQFNYRSAYKDAGGRMYFGSVKGLISFMPFNTDVPGEFPGYITGFQVNNKELGINDAGSPLKRSILLTDTINLEHDQSSFSIDFATLSFTSPEMTHYRYKMSGLDVNWTYLKTNRKVYFTGLAPGSYNFIFQSSNESGKWSVPGKMLTIIVSPPFWRSNIAYLLYALILIVVIYLVVKSYHDKLNARNQRKIDKMQLEKEREIYESKISFFTNVAHEIRTPLTLIIAPMERVMEASDEVPAIQANLKIMEKNANRLLNLTNQLLDFRKTEINGYHLNFVRSNISELLKDTFLRFKDVAQQKQLKYELMLPQTAVEAYIDQEAFDKILSNLLDNAVKYARHTVSVILPPPETDSLIFSILIKNDGHLIPEDKREMIFDTFYRLKVNEKMSGTGIGLSLARSLAELHKGTLSLLPGNGKTNDFELVLPVHQITEFDLKTDL